MVGFDAITDPMYLLRHIYQRHSFALVDDSGTRPLGLVGQLRCLLGDFGRPVGIFQWLGEGRRFAAYYCPPGGGRVRLDREDFAVADVVDAALEDLDGETSRLQVVLRDGRIVGFRYLRPREPFTLNDWYSGRTQWDMPAKIARALADPETRDEWARMEWAHRTRGIAC